MLYDINGNKLNVASGDICNVKEIGKKIIDGTIKTISLIGDSITDAGCKFIPMFNLFNEWLWDNNLVETVNDYYDGYGIHPNDAGYHIMLQIVLRELGVPVPFYEDLTVNGDYYPFA